MDVPERTKASLNGKDGKTKLSEKQIRAGAVFFGEELLAKILEGATKNDTKAVKQDKPSFQNDLVIHMKEVAKNGHK
jgi:hypothetical protein